MIIYDYDNAYSSLIYDAHAHVVEMVFPRFDMGGMWEKAQDRAPPRNSKLSFCGSGVQCSIIPDSGTTLLVGPEEPILSIYEALCKSHLVLQLLCRVGL
jgi:hypothetical protein